MIIATVYSAGDLDALAYMDSHFLDYSDFAFADDSRRVVFCDDSSPRSLSDGWVADASVLSHTGVLFSLPLYDSAVSYSADGLLSVYDASVLSAALGYSLSSGYYFVLWA